MRLKQRFKDSVSNWSRFQEILRVLAKNGFNGWIYELGLGSPHSAQESGNKVDESSIPRQLRLAFEELGPTFIKLGQILSTRPDLLPQQYIKEFSKLTDRIPSFAFSEVEAIIQSEFGKPSSEIFETIDETPLAAASISQVHRAKLREGEIRDVVIKVQRPNIETKIRNDIQILYFFAGALEKLRSDFRLFNLTGMVEEFQRTIYEELDFSLEANNIEDISKHLKSSEAVVIPTVIRAYSSKRILTMSEIPGVSLAQLETFPENVDRAYLANSITQFFLESIFFHGLFHCDAHAGNLIIQTEGRGKVGLVDFGMVGRIGPDLRDKLGRIFLALVTRDFSTLSQLYTDVAEFGKRFSIQEFSRDIERLLAPNLSKPLGEINVGEMMMDSVQIAQKYRLRLPRDLIQFYRAVVTLEHAGRTLDPNFTFLSFGSEFSKKLVQNRLSSENLGRDLFRLFEGIRSLGTEIPSQLKNILYKLESDSLFPMDGFNSGIRTFKRSNQLLSFCILGFGSFLSASILSAFQPESLLIWPLWALSGCIVLLIIYRLIRS